MPQTGGHPTPVRGGISQIEAEIRHFLGAYAQVIRTGDLERIMAFYAPDVVAFDLMPPLEIRGQERYRKTWDECFTSHFYFPVKFDYFIKRVFGHGDVAFCYSLIYMSGNGHDQRESETWMRSTIGLQKIAGKWKIVHEHNSVPLDPAEGLGIMNLKPDQLGQGIGHLATPSDRAIS